MSSYAEEPTSHAAREETRCAVELVDPGARVGSSSRDGGTAVCAPPPCLDVVRLALSRRDGSTPERVSAPDASRAVHR
jgi:hypothetical protein